MTRTQLEELVERFDYNPDYIDSIDEQREGVYDIHIIEDLPDKGYTDIFFYYNSNLEVLRIDEYWDDIDEDDPDSDELIEVYDSKWYRLNDNNIWERSE